MVSRTVIVVNPLGMHARAAAKFVHLATRFESSVRVARDAREIAAGSNDQVGSAPASGSSACSSAALSRSDERTPEAGRPPGDRADCHGRPAEDWVPASREVDGKSIMGILLLAAACGSSIRISADGPDESEAVDALADLVASRFGEDVPG